jgi:hypothetical protein
LEGNRDRIVAFPDGLKCQVKGAVDLHKVHVV